MENACWRCGDLFHHARECTRPADVDRTIKKEIQQHRRKIGISRRNSVTYEDKITAMKNFFKENETLPPVSQH